MEGLIVKMIEWIGSNFIGIFEEGARVFGSMMYSLVPLLLILLIFTDSLTAMIGLERIDRILKKLSQLPLLNITLLPILSAILLKNPLAYSSSKYLDEREKPAYYDALVSFIHPVTSLIPSANPSEIFVFLGIAYGVLQSGNAFSSIAVRYFICGILVVCFRGISTFLFYQLLCIKNRKKTTTKI